MDREWQMWERQFDENFGPKELLRYLRAFVGWLLFGFLLSLLRHSVLLFYPFLLSAFAFPFAAVRWKPAYLLLRAILRNPDLPPEPMPRRSWRGGILHSSWQSLLPAIGFWSLMLAFLYLSIRLIFR